MTSLALKDNRSPAVASRVSAAAAALADDPNTAHDARDFPHAKETKDCCEGIYVAHRLSRPVVHGPDPVDEIVCSPRVNHAKIVAKYNTAIFLQYMRGYWASKITANAPFQLTPLVRRRVLPIARLKIRLASPMHGRCMYVCRANWVSVTTPTLFVKKNCQQHKRNTL